MNKYTAVVEWYVTTKHNIIDENCPVPLFPPQTPYGQPWELTKAYMVINYLLKLLHLELKYVEDQRLWNAMSCTRWSVVVWTGQYLRRYFPFLTNIRIAL